MSAHSFRALMARFIQHAYPRLHGFAWEEHLRTLQRLEYSDPAGIQDYRWQRLEERIPFWIARVPFYRDHFSGLVKLHGRSLERLVSEMLEQRSLHHFPLLDKAVILAAGDRMHVERPVSRRPRQNSTGGSTGQTLYFLQDECDEAWLLAGVNLFRSYLRLDPGSRTAQVWGSPIDGSRAASLRSRVQQFMYHTHFCSTYGLTRERRAGILDELARFDPELLIGYPTSLCSLLENGGTGSLRDFPRLKAVWSASETLFPHQREILESGFGAPVFNNYGCREFGPLAMECSTHEGLHLNEGAYHFELLPTPEGLQEIVVTDLKNRIMPLVRYRIGDLCQAPFAHCSCGRGFRLLVGLEGRTFDLIRGPAGEVITGTFWTLLFRSRPGVSHFQVIQRALDRIEIHLETRSELPVESVQFFQERIRSQFRDTVDIGIVQTREIPEVKSGKFRFIISEVPIGEQPS